MFGFVLGRDLTPRPVRDAGQFEIYAPSTEVTPPVVVTGQQSQQQPPPSFVAVQPIPEPTSVTVVEEPSGDEGGSGAGWAIGLLVIVVVGYGLAK